MFHYFVKGFYLIFPGLFSEHKCSLLTQLGNTQGWNPCYCPLKLTKLSVWCRYKKIFFRKDPNANINTNKCDPTRSHPFIPFPLWGWGGGRVLIFLLLFWAPRGSSFLPERKGKVRGQNCGAGAVRGACPAQARGPCWLPRRRRASPPASQPSGAAYVWLAGSGAREEAQQGGQAGGEGGRGGSCCCCRHSARRRLPSPSPLPGGGSSPQPLSSALGHVTRT